MTPPIQVGHSFQSWALVAPLVLGVGVLILGIYEDTEPIASVLFAAGGVLLVLASIAFARCSSNVPIESLPVGPRRASTGHDEESGEHH